MESRSTQPAPSAQDWQDYLNAFEQEASSQGFADYLENLKARGRGQSVPVPIEQFAPLQVIGLIQTLSRAALLACVQLPSDAVGHVLARITSAAEKVEYGHSLPGKTTKKEQQIYQRVRTFIPKQLSLCGTVLKAMFECYASGDYDAAQNADELMRSTRDGAENGDPQTILNLIGRAGAVALRTKITWSGWTAEGTPQFRNLANVLSTVLEALQSVMPLGDIDTERQRSERIVTALVALKSDKPSKPLKPTKPAEPEEILALMTLTGREQPFTDDEIREMGPDYDRQVDIATTMLEGRHRIDTDDERDDEEDDSDDNFEDAKDFAVALGIRALGLLRPQSQSIVEQLIDVISDAVANKDLFREPPALKAAVLALGHIGQPAIQPCIEFLRYTSQHLARFQVANALGVAGRGNEEAFQMLLALAQQADFDHGRIALTGTLAKLHDDRAISWVVEQVQALAGPDAVQLSDLYEDIFLLQDDQFELMDALHELNAIEALDPEPNPDRNLEEGMDEPGAVMVRGYGRIARAVPANWDYPDRRPVDEDDFYDDELESLLSEVDSEIEEVEPPFTFTPPPKPQPIVNTAKVGRNDPCPCGSGKKYKHCHGKN